jgi:free fatty acid receptor 2
MSFGHCTIVIIVQYFPTNNKGTGEGPLVCYENFTKEQLDMVLPMWLELCLVLFFIPMVVTIFCCWCFVRIMLTQPHVGTQKCWRAVGLAAVTLFNFLVCFGPYSVSHIVGFFQKSSETWQLCPVAQFSECLHRPLDLLFLLLGRAQRLSQRATEAAELGALTVGGQRARNRQRKW